MRALYAVVLALIVATALASDVEEEFVMAERAPTRTGDLVNNRLSNKASLVMRALDADRDKKLSEADVIERSDVLNEHFPGVSPQEFTSFIEYADRDGDKMLSRDELVTALATGLVDSPELLELDAVRDAVHRDGLFREKGNFLSDSWNALKNGVKGAMSHVGEVIGGAVRQGNGQADTSQDACVMCQYLVERMETNVRQAGIVPTMPTGDQPAYSFLETEVKVESKDPYDAVGAAIIGSTRQSTRLQRQMERQKYNEIYRVVDITLDDVCEQAMPNSFYGYCKQIYKLQSDVVDGLRYQYRPSDICFRVGMCGKDSYITKGIHSRYK